MTRPPSGEQFDITYGDHHATIVEVGGGIREYRVGDRDVLHPYPSEAMCDGAHGAVLVPFPNRLGDGKYRFDGSDYQVALTEPEKQNAIHGFLRWRSWSAVQRSSDRVVMATRIFPMQGYPFMVDVQVDYRLDDAGLTVSTTATNLGDTPCPYGTGQHPYLSPGNIAIDECTLHLAAETRILTDPARQLPIGTEPVAGTAFDFREGRFLGDLEVDHAFTDLARDSAGRATVRLVAPDGSTSSMWVGEGYPIVEIFTSDTLSPGRRRRGLGAEPMTCPPNAFQSGEQVIRLEPEQSTTTTWGASLET